MKKVLIVDDETSVRKLVKAALRKQNIQTLQAVSASEAWQLSHLEHPDLIVMDVLLPDQDLDGLRLAKQLKDDPQTCDCKIILISGHVALNQAMLQESGADAYLVKPFDPIDLRQRITHLLAQS